MGRAIGDRVWGGVGWLMVSIFRGGPEGQRVAVLVLYLVLAPLGGIELLLFGAITPQAIAVRTLTLAVGLVYLYVRRRPTTIEWYVLVGLLPAITNAQGQWLGGPTLSLIFVANACLVLACVAVLFGPWFTAAGTGTFIVATLVAQLHLHDTDTALGLTAGLGFAVSFLVMFVHGAARHLRLTAAELSALYADREAIYRRMQAAADQERARIAGELHDDAIQALVAGSMQLDSAASHLAQSDPDGGVRVLVVRAREMIGGAVDRIRLLSFDLYPPQLESAGLAPALEQLARDVEHQQPINVIVNSSAGRVEHSLERLAYRTFKELTTNTLKHAHAQTLRLTVAQNESSIRGIVEDDGQGYDAGRHLARRRAGHIGLDTTAERVRLAGGDFDITSSPGLGTRVEFAIPLRPPDEITSSTAS